MKNNEYCGFVTATPISKIETLRAEVRISNNIYLDALEAHIKARKALNAARDRKISALAAFEDELSK